MPELWHSIRKPDEPRFYCIFIAPSHPAKGDSEALLRSADRIQQLQQQIEAWQVLLSKLGVSE